MLMDLMDSQVAGVLHRAKPRFIRCSRKFVINLTRQKQHDRILTSRVLQMLRDSR